ncbi:acyltransferase family protein [Mesorhizobium sp. A623]
MLKQVEPLAESSAVAGRGFSHPKYRADIDGLRAVAVLSVVAFHASPTVLPGGFIGVDIFFVISGFLISTIIFENLDRGTFGFREFYARRIRRIFPPLIIVMLACLTFGWFVLFSDEYAQLGKHVGAGAAFISNIALWTEAGYFDNAGETKPLLHLWSLGIEEQFYIVWPFLVWLGWKLRFNLAFVAITIAAVSLSLNVANIRQDAIGTFYSPQTRFWELTAGSLLAWVALYRPNIFVERGAFVANTLSLSGAGLLALGFVIIRPEGFPGLWAVLPVVGAVLTIAAGPSAWSNRLILSNKLAVWVGLISFPVYLWHWPLLSFGRIVEGEMPNRGYRVVAVAASILLAWISTRFIEKRLRGSSHGGLKVVGLLVVMAVVGITGYHIYSSDGVPFRRMAQLGQQATDARRDWKYVATRFVHGKIVDVHYLAGRQKQNVLFIGSSLMGQYYPRVDWLYANEPKPLLSTTYISRNHCTPIPKYDLVSGPENINCQDYYKAAMEVARSDAVVKVVLAGDWPRFFVDGQLTKQGQSFALDLQALISDGKEVFLIGRPPMDKRFEPLTLARKAITDWSVMRAEAEDEESMADLGKVAALAGATLINPLDFLCGPDRCPVVVDGKPLYNDASHIRAGYAASSATFIDGLVER